MLQVVALWRYPVKSLAGERIASGALTPTGLEGDRAFGLVDETTGHVLTARREPRLLFATARWHAGEVSISGPDGEPLATDAELSRWLDRPVRLARAGRDGGVYENPRDPETERDWVRWQGPGLAWHDSGRVRLSLLSTTTLGAWAPERFRANVLLAGAGEETLVGERVRLGTAGLTVTKPVQRCVMVTRAQPGIASDRTVLRRIHRDRGGTLAIGAQIDVPGHVAVGDHLERDA